jgi:type I restriction enzyme S subunit
MNSEWLSYKLNDLCLKITDGAHNSPSSVPVGKPMASVKDLTRFGVDLSQARLISQQDYDLLVQQGCKPEIGDVLITKDGNSALDTVCNVDSDIDAVLLSSVAILRADPSRLNPHYLKQYLSSSDVIDYLKSNFISGAAIPRVVLKDFKKAEIKIPPIKAQEKIASFLDAFDNRIFLLSETNTILEQIAQTIFKSWFVDFDPVRAKQEGRIPEGMDKETAALFPDSFEGSELGMVPRGWKVEAMDAWLSVLETGRRPKGCVSGIEEGIPSIGAESVIRMGTFDYSKTKFVSHDFFSKMKSGVLESHDVLLYKDGGKPGVFLPRVSMFGEDFPFKICGINEHVFRIRLREPFSQTFLYFWLWSEQVMHELKHRGGKAAIPGINQSDVREQKLLVPSPLVLRKYEEISSPLISRVLNNAKLIKDLSDLRDTLLPRLISGKLRLPEAEAMLSSTNAESPEPVN